MTVAVAQQWPDADVLMAAMRGALHGDGGQPGHPALRVVCDLARIYRDHAEAIQHCGAPPVLNALDQVCEDWSQVASAEQHLVDQFNQVAAQRFDIGESSPGYLAATLAYWTIHAKSDTLHRCNAAINAYNRWLARLQTAQCTR
ncbi:hypothetical protein [Nocardia pseudovaccinii]|uniref:hypothetical protein n=1 Tax=Nocardia pseudovaccinii TaxID=189540 RepID=UPI0007A52A73|nr:hypothetical protein [Nocardia pseudovaccinii]